MQGSPAKQEVSCELHVMSEYRGGMKLGHRFAAKASHAVEPIGIVL